MTTTTAVRILICVMFLLIGWRHFSLGVRSLEDPQGSDSRGFVDGLVIGAICLVVVILAIFVPSDWCSIWP